VEHLKFSVEGSQGDPYEITFEIDGTNANAYCTCPAGSNGLYCKHRLSIMDGEVSRLVSDNTADVIRLKTLLQNTGLVTAYNRVLAAEAVHAESKKSLDAAKKNLSKAMHR